MRIMLTQERLKELLRYRKNIGVWKWKKSRSGCSNGLNAGGIHSDGYRYIRIDGKLFQSSRLAFLYVEGYLPENQVDHKNRIRDDDRWDNLRHVSAQCNIRNSGMLRNNKSGVKGIYWNKNRNQWQTHISVGKKGKFLGLFNDFIEAAAHRYAAEQCLGYANCDINSSSGDVLKNYLNRAKHAQAEDRVHRIGQEHDSVTAYYLVADGTIENDIIKILDKKRAIGDASLDGIQTAKDDMLAGLMDSLV